MPAKQTSSSYSWYTLVDSVYHLIYYNFLDIVYLLINKLVHIFLLVPV